MKKILTLIAIFLLPLATFAQVNQSVGPAYAGDTVCAWGGCEKDIIDVIIQKREPIWYTISFVVFIFLFIKIKKLCKKKNISDNIRIPLFTILYIISVWFGGIFIENLDKKYYEVNMPCIPGMDQNC